MRRGGPFANVPTASNTPFLREAAAARRHRLTSVATPNRLQAWLRRLTGDETHVPYERRCPPAYPSPLTDERQA